mmetsp:Transcript_47669/g.123681  ORF Transcript_47669/g.123681 Transcript_47669/m.123681 type:complete len:521 (+) Transcript_47669:177-1739(+)
MDIGKMVLIFVIQSRTPVPNGVVDHLVDPFLELLIRARRLRAAAASGAPVLAAGQRQALAHVLQHGLGEAARVGEAPLAAVLGAQGAQLQQGQQLVGVRPHGQHAVRHGLPEDLERLPAAHVQHLHHLVCELEALAVLEAAHALEHLAPGCPAEHESEVHVKDMAVLVDENVTIVPVPNSQYVADDGIRCHGPYKIHDRLAARHAAVCGHVRQWKRGLEVRLQRVPFAAVALLQVAKADGVGHRLQNATIIGGCHNEEGLQPKLELMPVEDVLEPPQEPVRELLLPHVVGVALHDHRDHVPIGPAAVLAGGPHPRDHLRPVFLLKDALRPQVVLQQLSCYRLLVLAADLPDQAHLIVVLEALRTPCRVRGVPRAGPAAAGRPPSGREGPDAVHQVGLHLDEHQIWGALLRGQHARLAGGQLQHRRGHLVAVPEGVGREHQGRDRGDPHRLVVDLLYEVPQPREARILVPHLHDLNAYVMQPAEEVDQRGDPVGAPPRHLGLRRPVSRRVIRGLQEQLHAQ